ncbi:hypothetical protein ZEAMMB73_Zm00001d028340 [Zea mays]|uniref:Uncharacterized protein n=1 Tax=Zea mays TaxID=4577 RepID=A0A1D6JVB6_MAIZE|nr:hypothetical protein ZEAMMB73_Zm00001d028340 [Zea mays]
MARTSSGPSSSSELSVAPSPAIFPFLPSTSVALSTPATGRRAPSPQVAFSSCAGHCDLAASRPGLPWLPPWRTSRSSRDASSRSHVNLLCVTPSACST